MSNPLNTKAKKIWCYWFLGFISINIILILSLTFVTSHNIISNIFFGMSCITLSILVFSFLGAKKNSYNEMKNKDSSIDEETILAYYPNEKISKNKSNLIKQTKRKRILYQITWSIITSSVSIAIALIYAFI